MTLLEMANSLVTEGAYGRYMSMQKKKRDLYDSTAETLNFIRDGAGDKYKRLAKEIDTDVDRSTAGRMDLHKFKAKGYWHNLNHDHDDAKEAKHYFNKQHGDKGTDPREADKLNKDKYLRAQEQLKKLKAIKEKYELD